MRASYIPSLLLIVCLAVPLAAAGQRGRGMRAGEPSHTQSMPRYNAFPVRSVSSLPAPAPTNAIEPPHTTAPARSTEGVEPHDAPTTQSAEPQHSSVLSQSAEVPHSAEPAPSVVPLPRESRQAEPVQTAQVRGPEAPRTIHQPYMGRPHPEPSASSPAPSATSPATSSAPQHAATAPSSAQAMPQVSAAPAMPHQIYRGQGPHNGDWLRDTMRLPPAEAEKKLQQDPRFQQLPPQRQQQLKDRLEHFSTLPPQQQQRVLNRMEMLEHLPPQQQSEARALFGQFRNLPPERKQMMRRTLHQMRTMPPDARERLLNSPDITSHYSPQEVQMLHSFNAIGFIE